MEKPPAGKVLLDDTVPLTAAIEASQSLQSHTVRGPVGGRAAGGGPGPRGGCGLPGAGRAGSSDGDRATGWATLAEKAVARRWVWVRAPGAQANAEARRGRGWGPQPPAPRGGRSLAATRKATPSWGCGSLGLTLDQGSRNETARDHPLLPASSLFLFEAVEFPPCS